jgi:HK97 family phage prohead protease
VKHFDFSLETKALKETGEFEGYASTFGNVDQGGDVVEPGAFIESVVKAKKDGRSIPMLWQHDHREPIGVWKDIAEDAKGLFVQGQLLVEADPLAKRAHALLKAKALGGMSIGYAIPPGGAEPDDKRRVTRLKKIDLREISLVTMPMNIEARVTTVKTLLESGGVPSLDQFDDILREAGFSKSQRSVIAGKGFLHLLRSESGSASDEAARFLAALGAHSPN